MDNQMHNNQGKDEDELVFQDLTPEQPATRLQKSMIRMQQYGPSHWSKRQRLLWMTVPSCLLLFFLAFEFINGPIHQTSTTVLTTSNHTTTTIQMLSYANVLYILTHQLTNATGQLEALDSQTGKIIWSYTPHNTDGIKLVGNILYIQTETDLVALSASNRQQIWEKHMTDDNYGWQINQGILFTLSTDGTLTVINAATGVQLWQKRQTDASWQLDHSILYMQPATNFGLTAFNAQNGQQLWYNPHAGPDWTLGNGNVYLKDILKQRIEALDGKNGTMLWQFNTHGEDPGLSIQDNFLFLTDVQQTKVEVLNDQTGKLLWQRPGSISSLLNSPGQTALASVQKNETDIIRNADGSLLYTLPHARLNAQIALENKVLFFLYTTPTNSTQQNSSQFTTHIEAIQRNNGTTIWKRQITQANLLLQNNTLTIVSTGNNSLQLLRAETGQTIWQRTFDAPEN